MNELEFQEEWLSAYLDDELTDGQRHVVEQRLAIDAAAQATLADLRRVRAMVAKLPRWSGPDLKFATPAELPGSFDEAEAEFEDDSDDNVDDDLDDFEEVPRSLADVEEPRVVTAANAHSNFNSQSRRSMLGWLAMAASVLLVAGMGYVYWPRGGREFAIEVQAPSVAKDAESRATISEEAVGFSHDKMSSNGDDVSNPLSMKRAPSTEGAVPSRGLGENADPAPLAGLLQPDQQADFAAPVAEERLDRGGIESKLKEDSFSHPESLASQEPAGGLGGFGAGATKELALGDAPVAELPPPGLSSAPRRTVPPEDSVNGGAADDFKKPIERYATPASNVLFARSQSWMDEEAQASLSYGQYPLRADHLVFGKKAQQSGANQKLAEVSTEGVLMAAIKPEVASSPDFFPSIIDSNQLIEMAIPNSLPGNSFALFVNRDEADRILRQLQEKGQISSQVWRVIKQPEKQAAPLELGMGSNKPASAEPLPAAEGRTAGKAESAANERVILMLNGPPN